MPTRGSPQGDPAVHDALARISDRVTGLRENTAEQLDVLANRIEATLSRIETRFTQRLDRLDTDTVNEFAAMRIDVGELRDRMHKLEQQAAKTGQAADTAATSAQQAASTSRVNTAVVVGAMQNTTAVAAAAAPAAAQAALKTFWTSTTGRFVKWCTAVAGIGAAVQAMPGILKFASATVIALWKAIIGLPSGN